MNKKVNYLALACLWFASNSFASPSNVIEIYNDCASTPCCSNYIYLSGFYAGINLGRSNFNMNLHRPDAFGLAPLNDGDVNTTNWSVVPAIGFDAYPSSKIPLRLELSYFYSDDKYTLNPLFDPDIAPGFFADDNFRIYNTMLTAYIDWRNCTRFVPFIGASYGWSSIKTGHFPSSAAAPNDVGTFTSKSHNSTWGGTIGTRIMLTCHIYGNVQIRYSSTKSVKFNNHLPQAVALPNSDDYLSDFLHEKTLMLGLAYVF